VLVPLPPLPEVIPFPVYGLADGFSGLRWMVLWNDPSHLSTVSLGHGHPDDGVWTVVTTVSELVAAEPADEDETAPPLITEAAMAAALSRPNSWDEIEDFARVDVSASGTVTLVGWDQARVTVGGETRDAWVRRWDNCSAIVLDLPPVAVAIVRHGTPTGPSPALADVTHRLADYPCLPEPDRSSHECDDSGLEDALDRLERIHAVQSMEIDREGPLARVAVGVIADIDDALTERARDALGRFPFTLEKVRPNIIAREDGDNT
jgi:hypothetical protein